MTNYKPDKITKPIQLIAFLCIAITAEFIAASKLLIDEQKELSIAFGISAIASGLSILYGFFIMVIKYRHLLLGDSEFLKYLDINKNTQRPKFELEVEHIKNIKTNKISIFVNDLLPDFDKIKLILHGLGLAITSTFGSNSSTPRIPDKFVLVFGSSVDHDILLRIILELKKLGLTHLRYSSNPNDNRKIYIGAFFTDKTPLIELSNQLEKEINSTNSMYELISKVK